MCWMSQKTLSRTCFFFHLNSLHIQVIWTPTVFSLQYPLLRLDLNKKEVFQCFKMLVWLSKVWVCFSVLSPWKIVLYFQKEHDKKTYKIHNCCLTAFENLQKFKPWSFPHCSGVEGSANNCCWISLWTSII